MSATPPLLQLMRGDRARPRTPANSEYRPRDGNAEARVQAAIVQWIRTVAPDLIIFAVPNGGLRTKREAARLRWTCVLAGVPDLTIIGRDGQAHFIEVKTRGGRLSDEQVDFRDRCVTMRIPFIVARSIDDVRTGFRAWAIATREAADHG